MAHRRSRWLPLALLAAAAGWTAFARQPPAEPPPRTTIPFEEEDPNVKPPPYNRIDVDDDQGDVAAATGAYYVRLDDVVRGVAAAKNPAVKEFLAGHTVAFDQLTEKAARNKPRPRYRITPVPLLWQSEGGVKFPDEFGVVPLDEKNHTGEVKPLTRDQVVDVKPFERLAVTAAERFLSAPADKPGSPKPGEKLAAAERLLSETLLFHEKARELNRRKGKVWDAVRAEVHEKLIQVRLARLRQAVQDKDWTTVRTFGKLLDDRYRNQPKILEVVFAARLAEAEEGLKSERTVDLERVQQLLNEYDARFPNSTDETAKRLRKVVADRAEKLLAEATRLAVQNPTEARNVLRTVESLNPDLPGLRQQQQELRAGYAALVVGTRRMPEQMSPALARWDSERQAVELMFEGLIEAVPDESLGVRFWPALATDRPLVGAGVRDLSLVGSAEWAGPDRGLLDPGDLTGTVDLLRTRPDTWEADPVAWIKDVTPAPAEPGNVRIRFDRGHPDPRGLLTFKILPARWLSAKGKQIDDGEFARRPFGTGPFRLSPAYRPAGPGGAKPGEITFVSNPAYGRRPGRMGTPAIKEIRFVDLARVGDPVELFRGEAPRLHMLPDVPTTDLAKFTGTDLKGKVEVVEAIAPRRVHILAVNFRRPSLQSVDLRRGLLHAVDRDLILNEVFRASRPEYQKYHRAMTGPFPPASWASARPLGVAPPPLFNRDLAAAKFRTYRDAGWTAGLRLAFAADDPQARAVCERIKADVEAAGGGAAGTGVSLELEPLTPADLYRQVQDEHRYDLAYLPFDYRTDWYPVELASFLDPTAASPGGRNYLGFFAPGTEAGREGDELARRLVDARLYRDPGRLGPLAQEIHRRFNDAVPFVPLWHLDRHMVVSTAVKVYLDDNPERVSPRLLDPTTVFNCVGKWRVE